MVDYQRHNHDSVVERVQITDFENAAYLPKDRCVKGMLAGNDNWRSPEAHFKARLSKPTDTFSFGALCIYGILGRVIFGPDEDFHKHHAADCLPTFIRLQRQVSYFGDEEGVMGLLEHITDEEVGVQVLRTLWEDRFEENIPYRPFTEWPEVTDASFKDLIMRMMNLDPKRRITAAKALEHPWFEGV